MAEVETFHGLRSKLEKKQFAPVYLIYGEEGYYIDELARLFENILPPAERDFNLYTLYAPQISPATVVETCSRYPMMTDRQVVIVKEAQQVGANFLNALAPYAAQPSLTTVLAIIFRAKDLKAAELVKKIKASGGVIYESKKLRANDVGPTIRSFIRDKGLNIEDKALSMLQDYVGTDLSRIYNEVDKLTVVLGPNAMVTPEAIERNIGYSKEFNSFELRTALANRNNVKAFQIVDYFSRNPKNCPVQPVFTTLFNLFSDILAGFYSPDKSDAGLMKLFGFKWPVQLADIKNGMRNYRPWQTIEIISAIRRADAASKGVDSRTPGHDILRQLTFRILTCPGTSPV